LGYVTQYEAGGKNTHIPKSVREKFGNDLRSQHSTWDDKWAACLAFELTGKDLREWKARNAWSKGKHGKPFVFTGIVPE